MTPTPIRPSDLRQNQLSEAEIEQINTLIAASFDGSFAIVIVPPEIDVRAVTRTYAPFWNIRNQGIEGLHFYAA